MADPAGPDRLVRDFDLGSLVALRREVGEYGARSGLSDLPLYRFVVAVNEITTNAVRHGGGRGRLELWRVGDELHSRVTDHGPGLPAGADRAARPPADTVSGRGLWLARQGSERVTVRSDPGGTSVTLVHRADGRTDAVA